MIVISLDRSFVLNSCNSQYNQFYCLSYLQTSVYSSKEFVTLVYLCLYLVLLLEQPLHFVKEILLGLVCKTSLLHLDLESLHIGSTILSIMSLLRGLI